MAKLKFQRTMYIVCLFSLMVNIFFLMNLYKDEKWKLSWTTKAAAEAEAIAAFTCSGHGIAYLDSLVVEGKPVCECNTCYGGPDCSEFSPGCPVNVESGEPIFLEPFWMKHAMSSAILISGWHRMSYYYSDQTYISKELENHIRKLHAVVGNAVTSDRYIIFGSGSTQLLNAAVYALSANNDISSTRPTKVVASIPHYPIFKSQTEFFNSVDFRFEGDASMWKDNLDTTDKFIEIVTSPTNPEGLLKKAILHGEFVKTIYDHAYYWPHYTSIPSPSDEDLMIFTISKLTGHASSRFGWALVKDEAVFERMTTYMNLNTVGASRDAQLRSLKILKVVLEGDGKGMFEFAYKKMTDRWENLSQALSKSKRFSIQEIPPQYCNFFQKTRGPSPAYAWLKCEKEEDEDCYEIFKETGIIPSDGSLFSNENRHVRFSLINSQDDFDLMLDRINTLVSNEVEPKLVETYNRSTVNYKPIRKHSDSMDESLLPSLLFDKMGD